MVHIDEYHMLSYHVSTEWIRAAFYKRLGQLCSQTRPIYWTEEDLI